MIAFLDGVVAGIEEDAVVLDVGGVGYRVQTPHDVAQGLEDGVRVRLYTHQHVREDALVLYGFIQDIDRRLFVRLQSATGVGPKLALQVFNHLTTGQVVRALLAQDAHTLSKVPGIGAKTASRMALELKDRLDDLRMGQTVPGSQEPGRESGGRRGSLVPQGLAEVQEALLALGYQERETIPVLQELADELLALDLGSSVRRALQALGR